MSKDLVIGLVLLAIAVGLLLIGRPNRNGESPRFLQFETALILYPAVVLVIFAMGAAEVISALLSTAR